MIINVTTKNDQHLTAEVLNPDLHRYEITAARKGWPPTESAPITFATFVAWAALTRQGDYNGTFETFAETDAVKVEIDQDTIDAPKGHSPGLPAQP